MGMNEFSLKLEVKCSNGSYSAHEQGVSMVFQEEKQRSIGVDILGGADRSSTMAMTVRED